MFCFQCEQTAGGKGCEKVGVCGKTPETATMQDALLYTVKGISQYAHQAALLGARDHDIDLFVVEALFTTITNVNFDHENLALRVKIAAALKDKAKALYEAAAKRQDVPVATLTGPAQFVPSDNFAELMKQAEAISIPRRMERRGEDATALMELALYGLKGMAAYADHALILGVEDLKVYAFFHEAMSLLAEEPEDIGKLLALCLKVGELNFKVMGMLDKANTQAFGDPTPTPVRITPVKGKAILVSGHDLDDLDNLLLQTAGKGINIYTHGEMLPCHGYPELRKHPHLIGNYGGAWQEQKKEFEEFPGAVLMTTNCIQKPRDSYLGRIFSCGLVRHPGVKHIVNRDFRPVIEAALAAPGFEADAEPKTILTGFGHAAVMAVSGQVIDAVKSGAIRHFFLIGGCDGAKTGRDYYTELAEKVPADCVIMTLACGKYRFNKLQFGDIGGIPRLLDIGQCNDAYSAIQIAVALAGAFKCGVNELPLSMILSWYEQKAVCILLTLLHLGIKNIRLGPSLPACVTPAVLKVLVDNYNIMPISTPDEDLKAILG